MLYKLLGKILQESLQFYLEKKKSYESEKWQLKHENERCYNGINVPRH